MTKVNKILQSIDSHFPQTPEAKKKRRDFIYIPLATAALAGIAFGTAAGIGTGFRMVDEATQQTVDSFTDTVGKDEDYITLARRAVIDLGLSPDEFNAVQIGQDVEGDATPQPGQQVTFDEVKHWYGATTVQGHTEDTDQ